MTATSTGELSHTLQDQPFGQGVIRRILTVSVRFRATSARSTRLTYSCRRRPPATPTFLPAARGRIFGRGCGPVLYLWPMAEPQSQMRPPSGLFPGLPPRPVYREPH